MTYVHDGVHVEFSELEWNGDQNDPNQDNDPRQQNYLVLNYATLHHHQHLQTNTQIYRYQTRQTLKFIATRPDKRSNLSLRVISTNSRLMHIAHARLISSYFSVKKRAALGVVDLLALPLPHIPVDTCTLLITTGTTCRPKHPVTGVLIALLLT